MVGLSEEELKNKELELLNKEVELKKMELDLLEKKGSPSKRRINILNKEINISNRKTLGIIIVAAIVIVLFLVIHVGVGGAHTTLTPATNSSGNPNPVVNSSGASPIIKFTPMPSSELSQINNYPSSKLILVAKELLNGSLNSTLPVNSNTAAGIFPLSSSVKLSTPLEPNGEIGFYFAGQDACQFCARDSWAVDLALAQFGSFNTLYTGHTYGDQNYAVSYWAGNISSVNSLPPQYRFYAIGNTYTSNKIKFISVELYPNTGRGFYSPSVSGLETAYPQITPLFTNASKYDSTSVSNGYIGTPLEAFGNYIINGAFTDVPVPYENFSTIINSFYSLNSQFALATVAGADMYVADACHLNNSLAPICTEYNWSAFYNSFG